MTNAKHKRQIEQALHLLEKHQGKQQWGGARDPVALLIETILSHNTNDRNRDQAFHALQNAYADWQAVVDADAGALAETIRSAGLNRQKAERIQFALRALKNERGGFTLDHLKPLLLPEALGELIRFPGVGKKTAGIVLTFGLKKPYFAVDTHINRISLRIGWVQPKQDAHDVLNSLVADRHKGQFHLQLIQHGRATCKARKPLCAGCVLQAMCEFYQNSSAVEDA